MKNWFTAATAAMVLTPAGAFSQVVSNLDDLNYWGSGPNRAAFVVDWKDSKANESLAWGYNWSGTLSVADMFADLVAGDPNFYMRWDGDAGFGSFVFGVGYQNGPNPFGVTGTVDDLDDPVTPNFVSGIWDIDTGIGWEAPAAFDGTPVNPADHYIEGFGWVFYLGGLSDDTADPSFAYPLNWTSANFGIGGINLVDNGWFAFSIGSEPGSAVAAVPEIPISSLLLGALIIAGASHLRRFFVQNTLSGLRKIH